VILSASQRWSAAWLAVTKDERKARKRDEKVRRQRAHRERQTQSLKARGLPAHEVVSPGCLRG
jgi:hypothetical protein